MRFGLFIKGMPFPVFLKGLPFYLKNFFELWLVKRNSILLDIGSSLDTYFFNRKSRAYHYKNSEFANGTCVW